jgi:hypothetical protein
MVDPTCRRCRRPVRVSAEQFEVFEQMHYTCFHYEFEHDPFDPDEECAAGGCPSASISPTQRPEEPRDTIVDELVDALRGSQLVPESLEVRIDRNGPGTVLAKLDNHAYVITVRTKPPTEGWGRNS